MHILRHCQLFQVRYNRPFIFLAHGEVFLFVEGSGFSKLKWLQMGATQIVAASIDFLDPSSIYVRDHSGLIYGVNLHTQSLSMLEESFEHFSAHSKFISFSQLKKKSLPTKGSNHKRSLTGRLIVNHDGRVVPAKNLREACVKAGTKVATPEGLKRHRRLTSVVSIQSVNQTTIEAKSRLYPHTYS